MNVTGNRKFCSISGCLLLALLVYAAQTESRPSTENGDELLIPGADAQDDYADVDNVEFHHVKVIDGIMHEDHPIVMYKEDFVNEDYVPNKQESELHKKYKNLKRERHQHKSEKYHALKPEKIYFDVLPKEPIVDSVEVGKATNIDTADISGVLLPLLPESEEKDNEETPSKQELSKRPKKYHSRYRRELTPASSDDAHNLKKRNPYYRIQPANANSYYEQRNYQYAQPIQPYFGNSYAPQGFVRHPVQGKRPIIIDNRFGNEVWGVKPKNPPITPAPNLWHDSNPDNNDFSLYMTTSRPQTAGSNARPISSVTSVVNPITEAPAASSSPISTCVWAIVNCCDSSSSDRLRYHCFEQYGCYGAFWGINPCADNVRDNAINTVDKFYN